MEYAKAFDESWEKLCEMSKDSKFTPNEKQELVDKIEHLIKSHPVINEKITFPPYQKIHGLKLYKLKAVDRPQSDCRCLFAGFEILSDFKQKEKLLDESCRFISRLSKEFVSSVRRRFAIFDKTNSLTKNDAKRLEECKHKDGIKVTVLIC